MQLLRVVLLVVLGSLLLLTGCQSKLIYFPRPYGQNDVAAWLQKNRGTVIAYSTESGAQKAYLQRRMPVKGPPQRLWIVGAGNGSLALDLSDFLWRNGDPRDAFLLLDYPGYGACEGTPNPSSIKANALAAVSATLVKMEWTQTEIQPRLRLLGHSLGCAAVLQGAKDLGIHRGVLVSPFTSTMDMSKQVIGLPLGFLLYHRFDNFARLRELDAPGAKFIVFHGSSDEVIPVEMSRKLKEEFPQLIEYHEVNQGRHNDLFDHQAEEITAAVKALE